MSHRQGHLIQTHIHPLSNCKDTGEEPSSLHNSKHTKHTHATRLQTQHSTVAVLHTLNNTVAKGFKQMTYPCANNHCSTRYEQSYRHNKHTHTSQKTAISSCSSSWSWLYTRIPGTIIKFITNYIKGRKVNPTYRNHILKPTFLKLASFHPHYLIYNNNNNNNNIYLKSDIHKMFNRLYIKTYTNNITEIHV